MLAVAGAELALEDLFETLLLSVEQVVHGVVNRCHAGRGSNVMGAEPIGGRVAALRHGCRPITLRCQAWAMP
ncbi:MAG TPA: hypothetical protein VNI83_01610 [Vicinamibacterales bacterium]|nr:hypothetical protein [Vicinamibacterales bacterium]